MAQTGGCFTRFSSFANRLITGGLSFAVFPCPSPPRRRLRSQVVTAGLLDACRIVKWAAL